jgi:hypothetical protein
MDELLYMLTIDQNSSPVDMALKGASYESQLNKKGPIDRARMLLFGALALGLLPWVAFYNGYPTVTPDTWSYLLSGTFHIALPPYRAPGYGSFTSWTSLGASAWLTIAAQAILVVYVLQAIFVHLIDGDRKYLHRCMLAGVCVLAALTSLPWLVSELMPDVFAGVLFLAAFLLAFAGELRVGQRIVLALILMISVSAHMSLFPILGLYVAAVVVLRLAGRQTYGLPPIWSVLAWLLVPIIAAGFWTATQNQNMGLGFRLSPSKNTFLLGRLFGDGLAPDFLREQCPKRPFVSCRYLSNLPRSEQEFMFQHPLLRDLKGHDDEVDTIVHGTLFAYPRRFLVSSAKQTLLQLVTLRTGEEMRLHATTDLDTYAIQRVWPLELDRYRISRQFGDSLRPLADAFARVHTTIFWFSVAACLMFARTGRFARIDKFFVSAIVLLVINAAVCGASAGVFDRYQNRVEWIMPLCLFAYICCLISEWERGVARQDPIYP